MDSQRVLVASPVYDGMRYCINNFINSIKDLSYQNYDFLLMDNSNKKDFFKELKKISGIKIEKLKSNEKDKMKRIIKSRNRILDYAIGNDYDYVLMMDCDVIPPSNIIKQLLSHKKDIVSGLYYNKFTINGLSKTRPVVWMRVSKEEFNEMKKEKALRGIKSHLELRRHMTLEEANSGKLFRVFVPSAGCMLISKEVFRKVRYGLLNMPDGIPTSDDAYFFIKAEELGFKGFCDTRVKCKHLIYGKYTVSEDGSLVHPAFENK